MRKAATFRRGLPFSKTNDDMSNIRNSDEKSNTPDANTRAAIARILDGQAPNGIAAESCGPWSEYVSVLYEEHARGGTEGARLAWAAMVQQRPELAHLRAGSEKRYNIRRLGDAMRPQPAIRWYVEGVFAEGSLSAVVGHPGSKKTWLMLDAALAVADGSKWLGKATEQGPALIIDEESGRRRLERRIAALARGRHVAQDAPLFYVSLEQFDLREEEDVKAVNELFLETQARLVIIDALADFMPGGDENTVKDVQPVLMALRKIAEETRAAIVLIHHANKTGGYRGSSSISGALDLMLTVESKEDSPNIDVATDKVRDVEPFKIGANIRFEDNPAKVFVSAAEPSRRGYDPNTGERFVLGFLRQNGPSVVESIQANSEPVCKPGTARNAIYSLAKAGLVERADDGKAGEVATYRLTTAADRVNL